MTTIAYKDGIIAYDSRITKNSLILDDDYDKHWIEKNTHFFMNGILADCQDIIKAWFKEEFDQDICPISPVMVWDGLLLWEFGIYKNGKCHKTINCQSKHFALGSGEDHAFTAMDMGATSCEAVEMAMKRDTHTGGRIRKFEINSNLNI